MSVFDSKPEAASFVADDNLLIQKPSLQAAASKRLSAPKTSLISQAVDSIHTHLIDLPTVVDPKAGYGFGMAMLTRTTELTPIKQGFVPLVPMHFGEEAGTFKVSYAPKARGHSDTELAFVARFQDGNTEAVRIPIQADAYALTDPRYGAGDGSPGLDVEVEHAYTPTEEDKKKPVLLGFQQEHDRLLKTISRIFDEAHDGVDDVERNENDYQGQPPPTSIWVHLAQIAIEVALSQVSEHLGHLASEKLASVLGKALAEKHHGAIEHFGAGIEKAIEASAKETKITELDADSNSEDSQSASGDYTDRTEGNAVYAKAAKKAESKGKPERTAFFEAQKTAIHRADGKATSRLSGQIISMAEALGSDSPLVGAALDQASSAADKRFEEMKELQRNATTVQWMNALARTELGVASAPSDPVVTTMLTDVRMGKSVDGILEVELKQDREGRFSISRVKVKGVTSKTANHLLEMDLRKARMPIVIRLYEGERTITVDEVGRVRTLGTYTGPPTNLLDEADIRDAPRAEAQSDQFVETLVAGVLSEPLSKQGVTKVETDDAKKE